MNQEIKVLKNTLENQTSQFGLAFLEDLLDELLAFILEVFWDTLSYQKTEKWQTVKGRATNL